MEPFEVVASMMKRYSSCQSYCDSGELRVSLPNWGQIHFETYYLAPKNLMVKLIYGDPSDPVLTDTYWTNGAEFYNHSKGVKNACRRLTNNTDFFRFGLTRSFDFEVPGFLMVKEVGTYGRVMTPVFRFDEPHAEPELFSLIFDAQETNSIELSIRKGDFALKKMRSTENVDLAEHFNAFASFRRWSDVETKLSLLMGKPEIFPLPSIWTECIYHQVRFDEDINPELFEFAQVPRRPLPSSGNTSVALPEPKTDMSEEATDP